MHNAKNFYFRACPNEHQPRQSRLLLNDASCQITWPEHQYTAYSRLLEHVASSPIAIVESTKSDRWGHTLLAISN